MRYGLVALVFGLNLLPASGLAATRYVSKAGIDNATCSQSAPCASVQHAVTIAATGDTVSIANGTYSELAGVTIDKSLTVEGASSFFTRVYGGAIGVSVFSIEAGATVTIRRLYVRHGLAVAGGGIFNLGDLTLEGVRVWQNKAAFGGGIFNAHEASLRMYGSFVSYNVAIKTQVGCGGGGIFNRGFATLDDVTVLANQVSPNCIGGGIINLAGLLRVARSLVSLNDNEGIASEAPLIVIDTTVSRNWRNGIRTMSGGHTLLNHVTVAENGIGVGPGNGTAGLLVQSGGELTLWNTIVANNSPVQCFLEGTALVNGSASLDSDNTCGLFAPDNLIGVDPKLGPLKDNGGTTQTHALRTGSPAIDHAFPEFCTATDQRGVNRPVDGDRDGDARCDIGAFEFVPLQREP
jgi:hypothetical protein